MFFAAVSKPAMIGKYHSQRCGLGTPLAIARGYSTTVWDGDFRERSTVQMCALGYRSE